MLEIDGSYQEGGGQILRTALSLSCLFQIPCKIFNIRKNRPEPGLKTQHLLVVNALKELFDANVEGDFLNSQEITFFPGKIKKNHLSINIPTAASITLISQALLPPLLFSSSPTNITFYGGATDTFFSPTLDYFQYVFLRILKQIGANIEINVLKRGYYPEGGAKLEMKVFPATLKNLNLIERGNLEKVLIISGASEDLKFKKVSERQAFPVKNILKKLHLPFKEKIEYHQTKSSGSHIFIGAFFQNTILGADNLGKMGVPAENIGQKAISQLLEEEKTKACLDRFLGDQILVYLALSREKSCVSISHFSSHFYTNKWVIEKFLKGKFKIEKNIVYWLPKD